MGHSVRMRRGFTLVEAAICAVVVALMGVAAGSAAAGAAKARESLRTRAQASAAAEAILAETLGKAFDDPQSPNAVAGLDAGETTADRSTLDDVDDFDALKLAPIKDIHGAQLAPGTMYATIDVNSIDPITLARSATRTGLALVRVRIFDREHVVIDRSAYRARNAEGTR